MLALRQASPREWGILLGACRLLPCSQQQQIIMQTAGLKNMVIPDKYDWVEFPERRKLMIVQKVPSYPPGLRPPKMQKHLNFMRGPELIHNQLIHKQYGIVALQPGRLKYGHFEMIRMTIARKIETDRMFAIWRLDPPWQPVTKKSAGMRMGGGKGGIHHYVTPIKTGRIIIELGGKCEFDEVQPLLKQIAHILPFKAKPVSNEILQQDAAEKKRKEETNINPYTFKYVVLNNLGNSHNWISPYDRIWFGEHI